MSGQRIEPIFHDGDIHECQHGAIWFRDRCDNCSSAEIVTVDSRGFSAGHDETKTMECRCCGHIWQEYDNSNCCCGHNGESINH